MLDTNISSYLIKNKSQSIRQRLQVLPMSCICISSITEAELLMGLAKKPAAKNLSIIVGEFLARVERLPWDSEAAKAYAKLRTSCNKEGKSLGQMDMLIASHSVAVDATLVTNDKAFYHLSDYLRLEDWSK